MPRLNRISIENFRSIGESPVVIKFPENSPVILIGENNAGKTNLIRAVEILFGESYPKYKKLDDFDHFNRNPNNRITIRAEVSEFAGRLGRNGEFSCGGFEFTCKKQEENDFCAIQAEDGYKNKYVSNNLREELLCVIVSADQNLSYQLSYASKYTLLSKVTKAFHDKLTEDQARVNRLKGFFDQIQETFLEVPDFRRFSSEMSLIAGEMLSNMTHALKFDFSAYDPSNYFKTLRVHPTEDGEIRAIEELGTGQQQILALSFAHAYAKSFLGQGLIFVLDEPETHLHPLAQKWLAKKLFEMVRDGIQVIVTTHSPYFINLEFLDGIYLVRKDEQTEVFNTNAHDLTQLCINTGATRATEDTIIPFYTSHSKPHILSGFFAKKLVLVEGETEEMALPIYLEAVGCDTLKDCIAVIAVGGKGNLGKWWRLFKCYGIPTFICFDNDTSNDSNGLKRRDALKAIGIRDESIEEVLTTMDWNLNEKYCVFGTDFETTMRSSFEVYHQFEEEEKERLGSSNKPVVARAVAERIRQEVEMTHLGWANFKQMGLYIRNI